MYSLSCALFFCFFSVSAYHCFLFIYFESLFTWYKKTSTQYISTNLFYFYRSLSLSPFLTYLNPLSSFMYYLSVISIIPFPSSLYLIHVFLLYICYYNDYLHLSYSSFVLICFHSNFLSILLFCSLISLSPSSPLFLHDLFCSTIYHNMSLSFM